MLSEIIQQVEQSERLLARAQKLAENVRGLRSGDRVFTPLVASAELGVPALAPAVLQGRGPGECDGG